MHLDQLKAEKRLWFRLIVVLVLLISLALIVRHGASIWLGGRVPQLEKALTQATGLDTRIKGYVSATLWPTPGFALADIEFSRGGKPVLTAREFQTSFELRPLLDREFVPHAINIKGMQLQLQADEKGMPLALLPEPQPQPQTKPAEGTPKPKPRKPFRLGIPDIIELHDSNLVVLSADGKELHALRQFNLAVHPVHNSIALLNPDAGDWEIALYLNFKQAKLRQLDLGPTRLTARYTPHRITAEIEQAGVFDGTASGSLTWITATSTPGIKAAMTINNFDAARSTALFQPEAFVKGRLNLRADFSSSGTTADEVLKQLTGAVKLTGANLELVAADLDELITRIINAQNYNLVDTAAYFFIGPLGASATKGIDVANVTRELKKPGVAPTKIVRLVSSWNVGNGIATAQDVALETTRYRLALQGGVNLISREFDKVRIAVVNDKGCAVATQRLDGPVASPRTEKLNLLFTLARPLLGILGQSAKLLATADCEPFYRGELLPSATPAALPEKSPGAEEKQPR